MTGIDSLLDDIRARIPANRQIRRRLPGGGEIRIERQLPFLFVYRHPHERDDPGTASLIQGEAAYLLLGEGDDASAVTETVCETLADLFGSLLLIEIWSTRGEPDSTRCPRFRLGGSPDLLRCSTGQQLIASLRRIRLSKRQAEVISDPTHATGTPNLAPLLSQDTAERLRVRHLGLELEAIHQDRDTGQVYPATRTALQRQLSRALREAAFEFSRRETSFRPPHYQALGRRAFKKVTWRVDAELAAISQRFDLLMAVTPVNTDTAFREFEERGFERAPRFYYRPRTIDPPLLKRSLYQIPIERIDDPTLGFLFEEKRRELALKLTLVEARETPRFLPTSIALYGSVGADLYDSAMQLLAELPPQNQPDATSAIDAAGFAARAEAMLGEFRRRLASVASRVELQPDLTSLTVSNGNLLIGSGMTFSSERVEALLQHEVGTHVLTHWNGHAQPFRLLEVGLAGYDELQEGLAVFVEYLVGGLTRGRIRTLASRVLVARRRIEGVSFERVFDELRSGHGFAPRAAFYDTVRIFRGGGLVKDAVYLRGLQQVLAFLEQGGDLELLLMGKVATEHVPILQELLRREVLRPLALRPSYLDDPAARARLERAAGGLAVRDLLC